jgi:hypothetical protein
MARHVWKVILAGIAVVFALLALQGPEERKPPAQAEAPQPRPATKLVGKTTQKVLDLAAARAAGGVLVDNASEPEEGGLAAYGQAYRHSVATIGGLAVEQKLRLYRAEHDAVPATHAEFMAQSIPLPGLRLRSAAEDAGRGRVSRAEKAVSGHESGGWSQRHPATSPAETTPRVCS